MLTRICLIPRSWVALAILTSSVGAGASDAAAATGWTVNSKLDLPDATPLGDGIVDADPTTPGDQITLRAAIMESNALPSLDTIRLPPGIYALKLATPAGSADSSATGDLDVFDDVTITRTVDSIGPVIIDAKKAHDRVFEVIEGGLHLVGIEIRNGKCDDAGGGICVREDVAVDLTDSTVKNCRAAHGGGIFSYDAVGISLDHSVVQNCRSDNEGGGIAAMFTTHLALHDSVVKDCRAKKAGGGVRAEGPILSIERTMFVNNVAESGGGASFGQCEIDSFTDSQFIRNKAKDEGGGIEMGASHGLPRIERCTFSRNVAGSTGGGLQVEGGFTVVANSTFHQNVAKHEGGGASYAYGGIHYLWHCTLVGNKAKAGSGIRTGSGDAAVAEFHVKNTILANGKKTNYAGPGLASDGSNIDTGTSCAFTSAGDLSNTNPRLAKKLKDNGGPTPTVALLPGSPAIDAASYMYAIPTDQRLLDRVDHGSAISIADIGAFEVQ